MPFIKIIFPFNLKYDGLERDYEESGLNRSINSWNDVDDFNSLVIPDKTQYRIFFSKPNNQTQAQTSGVIAVRKAQGYEFAKLKGIQPASTDSVSVQGDTFVLHGGYDGYIYRQEKTNKFDVVNVLDLEAPSIEIVGDNPMLLSPAYQGMQTGLFVKNGEKLDHTA